MIKKMSNSGNAVIVDAAGAETIDTSLTYAIFIPFGEVTVIADGTALTGSNWHAFPPG